MPSRRASFHKFFEQSTLNRRSRASSSSVVDEIAPMWTIPARGTREAESHGASSSTSSVVPKSRRACSGPLPHAGPRVPPRPRGAPRARGGRWGECLGSSTWSVVPKSRRACSGRLANASLWSTLTTWRPRALQDSTKRAPMKPAAPVTRSVSDALTPPILRDLAWHLHLFFLCSGHDDQRVPETPFPAFQLRHPRGRGRSVEGAPRGRRQDVPDDGRGDVDGRARAVARGDDPAGEGPRHHLYGGEPRGGRLQSRGARPLRAHPALP